MLKLDELLAGIDRHGGGRGGVAGEHIDDVEDAQRVEAAEDDGHEKRRADQRQGDAEEDPDRPGTVDARRLVERSEEHTSELQSLMRISYAVFCMKKKNLQTYTSTMY